MLNVAQMRALTEVVLGQRADALWTVRAFTDIELEGNSEFDPDDRLAESPRGRYILPYNTSHAYPWEC